MTAIRNIRMRYFDPSLMSFLMNVRSKSVEQKGGDLSKFNIPNITLETLKYHNFQFRYWGKGKGFCEPIDRTELCFGNNVLFTSRTQLRTNASYGFSYMLLSRRSRLAAAIHVDALQAGRASFHRHLIDIALANLRKLAPNTEMTAFISGGSRWVDPELFPKERTRWMTQSKATMIAVVSELIGRAVRIETIDIGEHYTVQSLDPATGEYTVQPPFKGTTVQITVPVA